MTPGEEKTAAIEELASAALPPHCIARTNDPVAPISPA
jgi:hypothetical protein